MYNAFTIDVEDWFHILDERAVARVECWDELEARVEHNMDQILELLHDHGAHATFFWLGWLAERHKSLVRRCCDAGHEVASHGHNHVLPSAVGPVLFRDDLVRARKCLEDIIGRQVHGFRVAGFGITNRTKWAFDIISEVGYEYDSSVAPSFFGHGNGPLCKSGRCIALSRGNIPACKRDICLMDTQNGPLIEIPVSAMTLFGFRLCLFGGGYLRLLPLSFVGWGTKYLRRAGHPLVVYVHPREIDPKQPRLPLGMMRYFRSYINLKSTMPKLRWLCQNYDFRTMRELVNEFRAHKDFKSDSCLLES